MSPWGWQPVRSEGIWRHGPLWFKPFSAAIPWLTVLLLLAMLWLVGGTLTRQEGILFDLPAANASDGEPTSLVALVMPMPHDTLVFFDDARYSMSDGVSSSSFAKHLAERLQKVTPKTLLVLADRRVSSGEIARIAATARSSGAERLLLATRTAAGKSE